MQLSGEKHSKQRRQQVQVPWGRAVLSEPEEQKAGSSGQSKVYKVGSGRRGVRETGDERQGKTFVSF